MKIGVVQKDKHKGNLTPLERNWKWLQKYSEENHKPQSASQLSLIHPKKTKNGYFIYTKFIPLSGHRI